jgi:hypothetical protein
MANMSGPKIKSNQSFAGGFGKPFFAAILLDTDSPKATNWRSVGLPFWAKINSSGVITGNPLPSPSGESPVGTFVVNIRAENNYGYSEKNITIVISGDNKLVFSGGVGIDIFHRLLEPQYNAILDGGSRLPDGLSFVDNTLIGVVNNSGTWSIRLKVSHIGSSEYFEFPVILTFSLVQSLEITKKANINTTNWSVSFVDPIIIGGVSYACGIRYGDILSFELVFSQRPDVVSARFAIKGSDAEPAFIQTLKSDFSKTTTFNKTTGYERRHFIVVDFNNLALLAHLDDMEEAAQTRRGCLAFFEFTINNQGQIVRHATRPFMINVIRDTIRS